MKALVAYNDEKYLVWADDNKNVDYGDLFAMVNSGRWPDECHDKDWIVERSEVIAFFTDTSEIIG